MKKQLLFILFSVLFFGSAWAQLSATTNSTPVGCSGTNNGTASVTPSGGSNYTYKWSTGSTNASVTGLAAGSYTVTVYSSTGGSGTIDTIFYEPFTGSPAWNLNVSTGTNGTDPNFWYISTEEGGNVPVGSCGLASSGGNSDNCLFITSVAWQQYGLNPGAAYDAGGLCGTLFCPQTSAAAVSPNINTTGAHNLILDHEFIGGGSGLTDNASLDYSINGGTNWLPLDASLKSINGSCTTDGKWTYRRYNLPLTCNNLTNFQIRYNWVNNDDGIGNDPSVAVDNVTIRDSIVSGGGTIDSVVKTVVIGTSTPPSINSSAVSYTQPSCGQNNGSISGLSVTGGTPTYTYSWTNSSSQQVGTSIGLSNAGAGTYTIVVTDAGSCTASASFTLSSSSSMAFVTTSLVIAQPACGQTNGSITGLSVTGGTSPYTYTWRNSANTTVGSNIDLSNVGADTYSLHVTDNGGCAKDTSFTIGSVSSMHFVTTNLAVTNPSCNQSNGTITGLAVAGGSGTYTVDWKNPSNIIVSNTYTLSNAGGGAYTFEASDGSGCVIDTAITLVPIAPGPPPVISTNQDTVCANDSIQICVQGTYSAYHWNNGSTTSCIFVRQSGNYYVTATDNNGCQQESNHVAATFRSLPVISVTVNGDTMTSVTGNTFQWFLNGVAIPNATGRTYIAKEPGSYTLQITDSYNCTATSTVIPVGIQELSQDAAFSIYPNPVNNGTLQIITSKDLTNTPVQIFDAEGRIVLTTKIIGEKTEVTVNQFANGLYMVKIGTSTNKFIKQ